MRARLKVFVSYYRPYRRVLTVDLVCAFVVAGITLAFPLCAGFITRAVLGHPSAGALGQVLWAGALMLGLVALHALCNTFVDYQGHMMGTHMERDMRRDLFAHLQTLSFRFYDGHRSGQLMSRITSDLWAMGELAHHGPEDLAIAACTFVGVFVILFRLDPALSLVLLGFLPVMAVYALHFNRQLNAAMFRSLERIGDVNAQVEDTLSGIRVVQAFTGEAAEQRRFDAENARFVGSRRDGYRSQAYFYQGMVAFTQLMTIAVLVLGGVAIVQARLGPDALVTYLLCVGLLIDPIQRAVNFARLYQEGATGFARFLELMAVRPEVADASGAITPVRVRGEIEFRAVGFRYQPEAPPVLSGLDLRVRAGEFVALVGPSGAGKTTLCSLIPRFYDVTSGEILLDGVPIRELRLAALRGHIGVVQQEAYLFAGTVADNIRYGRPGAGQAQVVEAARRAGAHDFITALPKGYDTDIGQRGVRLSGGQRQRLSIARVFLKDPPILILDEATSALDQESERAVQRSLEALAGGRTTFVIAHRLSTVMNAERILVLTEGGIAEQGTHAQLLALGGVYARLQATQLRL